jgi:hypothetical protein
VKPLAYVYVDRDNGLAVVRGPGAKALCQAAEPTTGRRWRTTWLGGGWCIPTAAIDDLRAYARTLGRVIAVSQNPPKSRGQSPWTNGDEIPGQEALL